MLLLRYPLPMALTVAASLAQIGEFSFIVAGLGVSLGLLSQEGHDLILAGAILSITLNPLVFGAAAKLKTAFAGSMPTFAGQYGQSKFAALTRDLDIIRAKAEEKESQQQLKKQQLVNTFPLFSEVNEHALEELLLLFRPASASPGDKVIRAGERGDAMYFIASGAVEVRLPGEGHPAGGRGLFRRNGAAQRRIAHGRCDRGGFLPVPEARSARLQHLHGPPSATACRRQRHGARAQADECRA